MKISSLLVLALSFCAVSASLPLARAANYVGSSSETFDYPDSTTLKGNTSNGGTGWNATGTNDPNSTSWGSSTSTGSTIAPANGTAIVTGGQAVMTGSPTSAGSSYRDLGQTVDSGDFYFSYYTSLNTPDNERSANFALIGAKNGSYNGGASVNSTQAEKLAFGQNSNATPALSTSGNFGLNYFNSLTGSVISAGSPVDYNGSLTLVVGHISFNTSGNLDRVLIYLNPTGSVEDPALAYIDNTTVDLGSISAIRLFAGGASATPALAAASANFDDIRLGNTFSSVAVPEPGSVALLGGGLLFLVVTGCRRRLAARA